MRMRYLRLKRRDRLHRQERASDLYSVDPLTGASKPLALTAGTEREPAVSADGGRVLYISNAPGGGKEIFEMPIGGGPAVQLTDLPDLFKSEPTYAPDGSLMFQTFGKGTWVANADGTNATKMAV